MLVVLLGPPGAGKGTQARILCERYGFCHISTGDIIRRHIREGTAFGALAAEQISGGGLVPDQEMVAVVADEILGAEHAIFDGFPRTVPQARTLDTLLAAIGRTVHAVALDAADAEMLPRLCGRLTHPISGRTYHELLRPPHDSGKDDLTGEPLVRRDDDTEVVATERLRVYRELTAPLIAYYVGSGRLAMVDALAPPMVVADAIASSLSLG